MRGRSVPVEPERSWPYDVPATGEETVPDTGSAAGKALVDLVPYYAWSNRGPSTMRVWIPVREP